MKKIFIINGSGCSEKDTFEQLVGKYVRTKKYSIVNICKEAAKILGWNGDKEERDRAFLSDLMDLSTKYNDAPFDDVIQLVRDFRTNKLKTNVLLIDMRDPKDIQRAVIKFGAESVLIKNSRAPRIKSNHADANVNKYEYDYIINNNGTLKQLDKAARLFTKIAVKNKSTNERPVYINCKKL